MQFAETKKAPSEEGGMQSQHRLCVKWTCKARPCRTCKSIGDLQSGADFQSAGNKRDSKAGDPALPPRIAVRSEKSAFGYFSRFGEKYHPSPCFGKQERTCISSKRKERLFLFQGKEKRMFLLYCDKRNQKHRKGKEASPSLFKPNPFDK